MPELLWYGDIDGDKKPDFIFLASSNSTGQFTLFLSSSAENGNFVKKVGQWTDYDCY